MQATTPPATTASSATDPAASSQSTLLMMGFPSRIVEALKSFCACHSTPIRGGYLCSRCGSKVCSLPATCPVCDLTLILSTHLARSYHHLFPLRNWAEVSWGAAKKSDQVACFSCLTPFPPVPSAETLQELREKMNVDENAAKVKKAQRDGGVSESHRYECDNCKRHFCIDCDVFSHEVVHNCPGCLSTMEPPAMDADGDSVMGGTEEGQVKVAQKSKRINGQ